MDKIDFINLPLGLEQECGNGYVKLTDLSFDRGTDHYHAESEILDESHHTIGNFTIDAYIYNFYIDDHNMNTELCMEMDLKGDIRKIISL